jgi:hypothetical protein
MKIGAVIGIKYFTHFPCFFKLSGRKKVSRMVEKYILKKIKEKRTLFQPENPAHLSPEKRALYL